VGCGRWWVGVGVPTMPQNKEVWWWWEGVKVACVWHTALAWQRRHGGAMEGECMSKLGKWLVCTSCPEDPAVYVQTKRRPSFCLVGDLCACVCRLRQMALKWVPALVNIVLVQEASTVGQMNARETRMEGQKKDECSRQGMGWYVPLFTLSPGKEAAGRSL